MGIGPENPDRALNCDRVLLRCEQCGLLTEDLDLSMYILSHPFDHEPEQKWSVASPFEGVEYVTSRDLEQHYLLVAASEHLCPDCQKSIRIITSKDMQEKRRQITETARCQAKSHALFVRPSCYTQSLSTGIESCILHGTRVASCKDTRFRARIV